MGKAVISLVSFLLFGAVLFSKTPGSTAATNWPLFDAPYYLKIVKTANSGFDEVDERWVHLHQNNPNVPDVSSATVQVEVREDIYELLPASVSKAIKVRYVLRGIPISKWLKPPAVLKLKVTDANLNSVPDGVSALTVEVKGKTKASFQPIPIFVHLSRGRVMNEISPLITGDDEDASLKSFGPSIAYVDPKTRSRVGYPLKNEVTAWHSPPHEEPNLYLELMAPHSALFRPIQMWWDHVAHPGMPYLRGFPPKHGEDHRSLRVTEQHEKFPLQDGPRGQGWMSTYVSGQVRSDGTYVFAEIAGRIGWLKGNGTIVTLAGFRVKTGKDPIWYEKPLSLVRTNMELRGTWLNGKYSGENGGFRTPMDLAIDPKNDYIYYVASYEDNCIWKVQVLDGETANTVEVSVFAGAMDHSSGHVDATGTSARFSGPSSIVFDPTADVMYVCDQENDAIRRISRAGVVSTLFGAPGMASRLQSLGVSDVFNREETRAASVLEVTAAQASAGVKPDIYVPQVLRVDSKGGIILLELGYGVIRRLDPVAKTSKVLGTVDQKFGEWDRGWAWLDVDRWGNAGPLDGIYWCKFVGESVDGDSFSRFNEVYAWLPADGGQSKMVFPEDANYELWTDGFGPREKTNPPHYPWVTAVDPRGAVLFGGGGEHGLVRMRKRRASDPVPVSSFDTHNNKYSLSGEIIWNTGEIPDSKKAGVSLAMKHGWDGHNMIGMPDAWATSGMTASQLMTYFSVPDSISANSEAKANLAYFLKLASESSS